MTIIIHDRLHIPAAAEAGAVRPRGGAAGHAQPAAGAPSRGGATVVAT